MAFEIPTWETLVARIKTDLRAYLGPSVDVDLRWSFLRILVQIIAKLTLILYDRVDRLAGQITPLTATGAWLAGWATIRGVVRLQAGPAAGMIEMTGTAGASIPVGAQLMRVDGTAYRTVTSATIPGIAPAQGAVQLAIQAVAAGSAGNCDIGTRLAVTPALAGVDVRAQVVADDYGLGVVGGVDLESEDAWRERILQLWRQPPQGGAQHDYIAWAKEVPGVVRAWCLPHWLGLGTVAVLVTWSDGAGGERPPTDGELRAVYDWIDHGRALTNPPGACRPVTAILAVLRPPTVPVDFVLRIQPDTPARRTQVAANIAYLFRSIEPGAKLLLSHVREAMSAALATPDGQWDDRIMHVNGTGFTVDPAGNITSDHPTGLLICGRVTFEDAAPDAI